MDSEKTFLRKLEKAKTEDEKTWLTTKRLIDSLPKDLQDLVYSAAIPHWFDPKILRAMNPKLSRKINSLYKKLQKLPFVEPFEGRGHNIHELTRRLILDYLWKKQKNKYILFSKILAQFYEDTINLASKKIVKRIREVSKKKITKKSLKTLQQWAEKNPDVVNAVSPNFQIEYIYHFVIVQPQNGAKWIQRAGWEWHNKFEYSFVELNALVNSISEHIDAGRIKKGTAIGWINFFRGILSYYQDEYESAKEYFNAVINENNKDKHLNAEGMFWLGKVYLGLSEYLKARARFEEALPIYRKIKNKLGEAHCIRNLGDVHLGFSEYPEARARFEEVLPIYREIKNKLGEANCITSLGNTHFDLAEYPEARARFEEALPIYREIKNKLGEANCIASLGNVHLNLSEYPEARARFEEALPIYRKTKNKVLEANCIRNLGDVHLSLSEYPEARARFEEALPIYREIKNKVLEANCISSLGDLDLELKNFESSIIFYEQALEIAETISPIEKSSYLNNIARVYEKQKDYDKAIEFYNEALKFSPFPGYILRNLADIYIKRKDAENASKNLEAASKLQPNNAYLSLRYGELETLQTNYKEAINHFDAALKMYPRMSYAYFGIGVVYLQMENLNQAVKAYKKGLEMTASFNELDDAIEDLEKLKLDKPSLVGVDKLLELVKGFSKKK